MKDQQAWEALKECAEYLSETHYVAGMPIQRNYIGAGSILHKKMIAALQRTEQENRKQVFGLAEGDNVTTIPPAQPTDAALEKEARELAKSRPCIAGHEETYIGGIELGLSAAARKHSSTQGEQKNYSAIHDAQNKAREFEDAFHTANAEIEDLKQKLASLEAAEQKWIPIEDGLPKVDDVVLVETNYLESGKEVVEVFTGFMDEYGDLFSFPSEENYGWQFNDVVRRWCKIPTRPALPSPPLSKDSKTDV
jgi:hypothetical protein